MGRKRRLFQISTFCSIIVLAIIVCHPLSVLAQESPASPLSRPETGTSAGVSDMPKPAIAPTVGTSKYKLTVVTPQGTYPANLSIAVKDEGVAWSITTAWDFSDGPVTNVSTLEKGTLVLRKESLRHFVKPGQPWKPVAIDLDFTGKKASGTFASANGQVGAVALDLGGQVFGDAVSQVSIGCLPLAEGYSATFRQLDVNNLGAHPESTDQINQARLKVLGADRITVLAGTFDVWKVEVNYVGHGSSKETLWIAKDSRRLIRSQSVAVWPSGATPTATVELVSTAE